MPGIYIHIPFCKQACHYCDFHFSTSAKRHDEMVKAIVQELEIRKDYLGDHALTTLYFGGGTPSLLNSTQLASIMDTVKNYFQLSRDAEVTLEANPDDLSPQKLDELWAAGINRLSIGIQSFSNADLRFMNRAHHAEQALHCLSDAKRAGFKNISVDLMYGIQTLDDAQWKKNLELVFDTEVNHLSCYALTIEARTAFSKMISDHRIGDVDEEKMIRQFSILLEMTAAAGFEQYEISNFARNEKYSVHNTSYWKGESYLGLGPSAHSFDGASRQWNVRNNALYVRSISEGEIPFEREDIGPKEKFNEYILTHLRTKWGLNFLEIQKLFGEEKVKSIRTNINALAARDLIDITDEKAVLTYSGKLLADKLASDLFE